MIGRRSRKKHGAGNPDPATDTDTLTGLDTLMATYRSDVLTASSITPIELRNRFADRLWWGACQQASNVAPERVLAWYTGADPLIADALGPTAVEQNSPLPTVADAALAVAAVAVARDSSAGPEAIERRRSACREALAHWRTTNVLPRLPAPIDLSGLYPDPQLCPAALDLRDGQAPDSATALIAIQFAMMSGRTAVASRRTVRLLFDSSDTDEPGATGQLHLAMVPGGPAGCYPDPRTMSFVRADDAFLTSLTAAWAFGFGRRTDAPCVLWSITQDGESRQLIRGGSLGAAFAVAFSGVQGDERVGRALATLSLRAFRDRAAITGTVTDDGRIGSVDGLQDKFDAAKTRGWAVVAPAADRDGAERFVPGGLNVSWARSAREARRKATAWVPARLGNAALAAVILLAGIAGVRFASDAIDTFRKAAQREADTALAAALLDRADTARREQPRLALRLGIAAASIMDSPDVQARLISALITADRQRFATVESSAVPSVALGPDGLALTVTDRGVVVRDLSDPLQTKVLGTYAGPRDSTSRSAVRALALGDSGGRVMVAETTRVAVWDITDRTAPATLATIDCPVGGSGENAVVAMDLSDDERRAVVSCTDGTVLIRDVATDRPIAAFRSDRDGGGSVALDDDGDRVLVGAGTGLAIWNITDPKQPKAVLVRQRTGLVLASYSTTHGPAGFAALVRAGGAVTLLTRFDQPEPEEHRLTADTGKDLGTVGWTPDQRAVIITQDEKAVVWDLTARPVRPRAVLALNGDPILSAALSPDHGTALIGSQGGKVVLWNVSGNERYRISSELAPQTGPLAPPVVAAERNLTITVGTDGEPVLWDTSVPGEPRRLTRLRTPGTSVTASAVAGSVAATAGSTGTVTLWDVSDPRNPQRLKEIPDRQGPISVMRFRPDGLVLVTGGEDGAVHSWDLTNSARPVRRPDLASHTGTVSSVSFARNGTLVATGGHDGTIRLTDLTDPSNPRHHPAYPAEVGPVISLAVAPNGSGMMIAGRDQAVVRNVDLRDLAQPFRNPSIAGHAEAVTGVAYSADGRLGLIADNDWTISVWNLADPRRPHQLAALTGHTGPASGAAFGPADRSVVTGSADGRAIVWDLGNIVDLVRDPREFACREAGGGLDPDEWRRYVHDRPYRDTCAA
ncbi:hypothetical protein Val02_64910 [Virgisporangium aliadipatigenens]|uniref:WD40 repeat domain-containing protein n=1 Tax=Virgisporangium aliadipatigenens TaxID=741659 RepID=A0A8J3YTF5_9ACTN|nr:WD40 repeat domain-containing protein [Virgisporangium aliadipatigenens]GIJ49605.1 hypothetical protein Val02_64910 [Virgisporangium aliadipatigenens]